MDPTAPPINNTIPKESRLFIKRIATRISSSSFLKLSYETEPIHENIKNEEEKKNLLELTNNALVSCNLNYYVYLIIEIINYFKSLAGYNLFYFLFQFFYNYFNSNNKGKNISVSLWKRIICFNLIDILIYLPYKIYEMIKP